MPISTPDVRLPPVRTATDPGTTTFALENTPPEPTVTPTTPRPVEARPPAPLPNLVAANAPGRSGTGLQAQGSQAVFPASGEARAVSGGATAAAASASTGETAAISGPSATAIAQAVQVTGPSTENIFNVVAPSATFISFTTRLTGDLPMPNGGTLPANSSLTGAIIIPNGVIVGDVGAKLAAGDIAGALRSSPNLLTKSSLWFAVPNPGQALSNMLPGAANREPAKAATTVLVIPLDGRAPQFGGAAPESFQFGPPLPPNGDRAVAFNNMRASGDGSSVSFANAGFVLPVPGGDKVGGALATALERVAGRNNNPAQPGTFADDAVATVIGSSLRNAKIYAGFGWPGGISQDRNGDLSLSGLNTTVTVDPDRLPGQFQDWMRGRASLPGDSGDDGSFPVASYATGATIETLGALAAARGGPIAAGGYGAGVLLRLPGAFESATIDLGVAQGMHKMTTAMLASEVRNGTIANGDTALAAASTYGKIIDRALQRDVRDTDPEQIRDHLSRAMNYVGPDPRETALVRMTAAAILGDREVITRENARLAQADRDKPVGTPREGTTLSAFGIANGQSIGDYALPKPMSEELTRNWTIKDTTFGRMGGRGSAEGWLTRTVDTGVTVRATAADGSERETRIGIVDKNDGSSRYTAAMANPSTSFYTLAPEVQTLEAAQRYVAQAIGTGAMQNTRQTDGPRNVIEEIADTPLVDGKVNGPRVEALWDRFQARNPRSDFFVINDFLVDQYNAPGASRTERANIGAIYHQDEMTPARILNDTIFAAPGGKILIPPEAEGADDVLSAAEIKPAFDAMRQRLGDSAYRSRVDEAAERLYEAGFALNFGVPDLARAMERLVRERGPAERAPNFEGIAPRYRP